MTYGNNNQPPSENPITGSEEASGFAAIVDKLRLVGHTGDITINFYGGGDEGSIEDITAADRKEIEQDLYSEIEEWADAQSTNFGVDWWNNDGGHGSITIDLNAGTASYEVFYYTQRENLGAWGAIGTNGALIDEDDD